MKTDYRIMGRPYRGTRRVVALHRGFATESAACRAMRRGIKSGDIDPDAWVVGCRVRDDYDPVAAATNAPIPCF